MSSTANRMSLKAFFEALEGRLDVLSAEDLRLRRPQHGEARWAR